MILVDMSRRFLDISRSLLKWTQLEACSVFSRWAYPPSHFTPHTHTLIPHTLHSSHTHTFSQLLNALFGLNVAAQHTHLHSPYISSLPYNLVTLQGWVWVCLSPPITPPTRSSARSVYGVTVSEPLDQLFPWLHGIQSPEQRGKKWGNEWWLNWLCVAIVSILVWWIYNYCIHVFFSVIVFV